MVYRIPMCALNSTHSVSHTSSSQGALSPPPATSGPQLRIATTVYVELPSPAHISKQPPLLYKKQALAFLGCQTKASIPSIPWERIKKGLFITAQKPHRSRSQLWLLYGKEDIIAHGGLGFLFTGQPGPGNQTAWIAAGGAPGGGAGSREAPSAFLTCFLALPAPSSQGRHEGARRESLFVSRNVFLPSLRSSHVWRPWPLTDLVIGFQAMICTAVHANLIKYLIQAPSGATVTGYPVLSRRHGPPRHLPLCTQLSIKQSDVGVPG